MPFTVEQAIEQLTVLKQQTIQHAAQPLIVTVASSKRDAGKSYFCFRARDALYKKGSLNTYITMDPAFDQCLPLIISGLDYLFFDVGVHSHAPAASGQYRTLHDHEVRKAVDNGRVNADIFIYNPQAQPISSQIIEQLERSYALVIENPHNERKKPV